MGGTSVPTLLFQRGSTSDAGGSDSVGPEGPPTTASRA
ncbi:DUF6053 domain-containing protein [Lysobacter enzymogenes]